MMPSQGGVSTDDVVAPTAGGGPNPEDIRTGYAVAVQLAVYDGQLSWQVTGTYVQFAFVMLAGAVFPSFVGSDDNQVLALAGFSVSLGGIVVTAMFGSMVSRIRAYEGYWVLQAAALERRLDQAVNTVNGSAELSVRRSVLVDGTRARMRRFESVKSRHMLAALLTAFLAGFLGMLVLNVWRLVQAF